MTAVFTLGVDFGDQFCKVAISAVANDKLLDEHDILFMNPVIPSVLIIDDKNGFESGNEAQAPTPQSNISSLKRLLALTEARASQDGTPPDPFVFKERSTGELGVELQLANGKPIVSAIECISTFFQKLIASISSIVQGSITRAVFTVPDWFSHVNRTSMAYAIQMTGLEIFDLIPESTAAHIDYVSTHLQTFGSETVHNIAFIDIGHTATTISVLSVVDGTAKTQSVVSDPNFGGRNVDLAILSSLSNDNLAYKQESLLECQRAKEALHLFEDMNEGIDVALLGALDGQTLYKIVGSLHHIPDLVKDALKKAALESDQVHKVVLTGGSTRLLHVRDCISSLFPPGVIEFSLHTSAARGALCAGLFDAKQGHLPKHSILSTLLPGFISVDPHKPVAAATRTSSSPLPSFSLDMSPYSLIKDATQVTNHISIYSAEMTLEEPLPSQTRLVRMTPDDHVYAPQYLDKRANLLSKAFDSSNRRMDLMQALFAQTKAAAISRAKSPGETPRYLNNLALLLHKHYGLDKDISILNHAIDSLRAAQQLAADDNPHKLKYLSNLSSLLLTRHEKTRNPSDLDHSIEAKKLAVNLLVDGDINGGQQLNGYALLLESRFDRRGSIADLTEGVTALERAVSLPLKGDIEHMCHFNLGVLFQKLYNRDKVVAGLDKSIEHQRKAVSCASTGSEKAMYLNHLGESLQTLFVERWSLNDLDSSIECHRSAAEMVEDKHPSKAVYMNNAGKSLGMYFTHQKSVSHLKDAITFQRIAVDITEARHPNKGLYLRNLAMLLEHHYEHASNVGDLEKAIESRKAALALSLPKADHLRALAESLYKRYQAVHAPSDLEEAIVNTRKITDMTPDFMPTKVDALEKLAAYLSKAYDDLDNLLHLQEALSVQQKILELTKDDAPNLHRHLFHLGSRRRLLFDRTGNESDLTEAVSCFQQAIEKGEENDPQRPNYLNHLGVSLHQQYLLSSNISQLNTAIECLRQAVASAPTDEDRISFINNLAISLLAQFTSSGDVRFLNETIESYRMVVDLTPHDHQNRRSRLNNLGVSLRQKFDYTRQIGDLNEAIETLQAANSSFLNDGIPVKSGIYAGSLGTALMLRFKYSGVIEDIDDAIAYHQRALDSFPVGSIERAGHLNLLGNSYQTRYEAYGELHDLNRAIVCQNDAVRTTPDGHNHLPVFLNSLANCLRKRLYQQGDIDDLKQAISHQKKAIGLTPETDVHRAVYLSNLGISMTTYYKMTKDSSYLDASIAQYEMALSLTPDGLSPRADYLAEMGDALQMRGKAIGRASDLEKAIIHLEKAIELTPQAQPAKGKMYHYLGETFHAKFLIENQSEDLQRAIRAYTLATQHETGEHSQQFHSAIEWIKCARINSDPSLKVAYSASLEILPYLVWIGLSVEAQMEVSMVARSAGCDAAAAAIQIGGESDKSVTLDLALEWLEQGRSVLWNQILRLRSPFDKLKEIDPVLAETIRGLSTELDQHRALGSNIYTAAREWSSALAEEHFRRQHHLAKRLDVLLKQVQNSPDMQSAIDKASASDLKQCASAGIVVVLNMSELQSDALIIRSPDQPLLHISLDGFSRQRAQELQRSLSSLLGSPPGLRQGADRYGKLANKSRNTPDDSCRYILRELWMNVVRPIVELLQLEVQHDILKLPHIYWCPTGPLTFLPLHAAGLYGTPGETATLFQYAVSSYIPNLRTLCTILKKQTQETRPKEVKMLAVIQPETPGQQKLPGTLQELDIISRYADSHHLSVLSGSQGTRLEVMSKLEHHSWVHLSCHGIQHLTVPAYSGLILHDGMLSLLDLMKKPLPQAEFAFLAACQTAQGDAIQFDEAVHLAGGFLLAGFSSVIATMWSVRDDDGPEMTDKVYQHLLNTSRPDLKQSAYALHSAVQHLRSKYSDGSFLAWVPYIHMGL